MYLMALGIFGIIYMYAYVGIASIPVVEKLGSQLLECVRIIRVHIYVRVGER